MKYLIWLAFFVAESALASPRLTFEGVLTDAEGNLLEGPIALTFMLYDQAEGGEALWTEVNPEVQVIQGDFIVTLGEVEPFGAALATDAPLWIGIAVDGTDLSPRNQLTEAPRAAAAHWAADVTSQHIHPSAISIGDTPVIDAEGRWVGPGGPGGATDYQYRFTELTAGDNTACGLLENQHPLCWGTDLRAELLRPPPVALTRISVGDTHGCGIRENGEILCWGGVGVPGGVAAAPFGNYRMVAAGAYHSCALTVEGETRCWGQNDNGATLPPGDRFRSLAAGWRRTCGLTEGEGRIVCWGMLLAPPAGEGFVELDVGGIAQDASICGRRDDGSVVCTGRLAATPPVAFSRIMVGYLHACGLTTAGDLRCWGEDVTGEASQQGPGLVTLAAGRQFTCGLRQDGTAACWGRAYQGDISVPEKWL